MLCADLVVGEIEGRSVLLGNQLGLSEEQRSWEGRPHFRHYGNSDKLFSLALRKDRQHFINVTLGCWISVGFGCSCLYGDHSRTTCLPRWN